MQHIQKTITILADNTTTNYPCVLLTLYIYAIIIIHVDYIIIIITTDAFVFYIRTMQFMSSELKFFQ